MKIAIVDDEADARQHLQDTLTDWSLSRNCPVEFTCFADSAAFIRDLSAGYFSLVFMDIYMDGPNGLEAARQLRAVDRSCLTVFLTSSAAHRADAFSVHAFDYLEKPLDPERLYRTLDDALSQIAPQPCLELPRGRQPLRLLCSDILYITADLQYCQICAGEVHRIRISFREIEERLLEHPRFLNINRGILVNMDHVRSMSGTLCLMDDGSSFPIHTKRTAAIRQAYIDYQFARRTIAMVGGTIL